MATKIASENKRVGWQDAARFGVTGVVSLLLVACHPSYAIRADRALVVWRTRPAPTIANASGVLRLTCDQALEMALRNSFQIQSVAAQVDVATGEKEAAGQIDNPELRLRNVEIDKITEGKPTMEIAARFALPRPGVRGARINRTELAVVNAKADLERNTVLLRSNIKKRCAVLASVQKEIVFLKQNVEIGHARQKFAAERLALGAATTMDLSLAQLSAAEAEDLVHRSTANRAKLIAQLKQLMGLAPSQKMEIRFVPRAKSVSTTEEMQVLVTKALGSRADLRMAAAKVAMAKEDAWVAKAKRWPWIRFAEIGYGIERPAEPLAFRVAVAIEVPVFNWNGGEIAARKAAIKRHEIEERRVVLESVHAVARAVDRIKAAKARLGRLQNQALPAAQKRIKMAKEAIEQSAADRLQAFLVQRQRVSLKRAYLRAQLEYEMAQIDLESALGETL